MKHHQLVDTPEHYKYIARTSLSVSSYLFSGIFIPRLSLSLFWVSLGLSGRAWWMNRSLGLLLGSFRASARSFELSILDLKINSGYFKVSFDYENVTNSSKWVIGRGSASKDQDKWNVDILLATPGLKYTRGLSAAYIYLRMHPNSGVWMIKAAPDYSNGS